MSRFDAAFMLGWLRANGVEIDDPAAERIAAILAERAPPEFLEWLTASYPIEQDAHAYQPAHIARCLDCAGQTVNDEHGCQGCRARGGTTA